MNGMSGDTDFPPEIPDQQRPYACHACASPKPELSSRKTGWLARSTNRRVCESERTNPTATAVNTAAIKKTAICHLRVYVTRSLFCTRARNVRVHGSSAFFSFGGLVKV